MKEKENQLLQADDDLSISKAKENKIEKERQGNADHDMRGGDV